LHSKKSECGRLVNAFRSIWAVTKVWKWFGLNWYLDVFKFNLFFNIFNKKILEKLTIWVELSWRLRCIFSPRFDIEHIFPIMVYYLGYTFKLRKIKMFRIYVLASQKGLPVNSLQSRFNFWPVATHFLF
jgi:hypothetical protein